MHARFVRFTLTPEAYATAVPLAGEVRAFLERQAGFEHATFLGNFSTGEFTALVVWRTKEDADASAPFIALTRLGKAFKRLPEVLEYDIYEPAPASIAT